MGMTSFYLGDCPMLIVNKIVKQNSLILNYSTFVVSWSHFSLDHKILSFACESCNFSQIVCDLTVILSNIIVTYVFIAGESNVNLDAVIQDSCGVLFNFIKSNPAAWAPLISGVSMTF